MAEPCSCCSVARSCLTLWDPMDCSTPGFPVLHYLKPCSNSSPFTQWWHPTSSSSVIPSPPPANPSQQQGLFQWASSSHQVAKVLELKLQHQSLQWIFRINFLCNWLVWSPCCPRDSQESSPAHNVKAPILWYSAFFMVQFSHPYKTTGKP